MLSPAIFVQMPQGIFNSLRHFVHFVTRKLFAQKFLQDMHSNFFIHVVKLLWVLIFCGCKKLNLSARKRK